MKTLQTLRLAAASVLALSVVNAYATQETNQLDVTATVVANCTISATNLEFGNYDPIVANASSGADVDSDFTLSTTCTKDAGITTSINNGDNFNAGTRRMEGGDNGGGSFLAYSLFRTNYSTVWTNLVGAGTGAQVDTTVLGRIPKGQDATTLKVGDYTDTLTVAVDF